MNKQLVNKILITVGFLFLYRLLAYVPVPGVDTAVIASFFDSHQSDALGLMNMFSGNAVERLSIISLGIMPYITASIIMELLAATFPNLGQMKKERDGMVKYMQIVRATADLPGMKPKEILVKPGIIQSRPVIIRTCTVTCFILTSPLLYIIIFIRYRQKEKYFLHRLQLKIPV